MCYGRRQWHPTPVLLPGKSHGRRSLVGCSPWGREESGTTERLYFHFSLYALEKKMATHSSVFTWRIPGTGEPGGLPSMGSHTVGHDWSDLAAAAAELTVTETIWHGKPKTFSIWPFAENVCWPLTKMGKIWVGKNHSLWNFYWRRNLPLFLSLMWDQALSPTAENLVGISWFFLITFSN